MIGEAYDANSGIDKMFDSDITTMYHSKCKKNEGVAVKFENFVELVDIRLPSRTYWSDKRFRNVCLYADGVEVICTSNSYVPPWRLDFSKLGKAFNKIIAKEFKLLWTSGECAQIAELDIYYKDVTGIKIEFGTLQSTLASKL